jgi:hypothetical protein
MILKMEIFKKTVWFCVDTTKQKPKQAVDKRFVKWQFAQAKQSLSHLTVTA